MKNNLKKIISVIVTLSMILGSVSISSFAADIPAPETNVCQIEGEGSPEYYVWDGTGFSATGSAVVKNSEEDSKVTVSTQIHPTDTENEFDITLTVNTTEKVKESESTPDAAVALVMDFSSSMTWCAGCSATSHSGHMFVDDDEIAGCDICGESEGHHEHYAKDSNEDGRCDLCEESVGTHKHDYVDETYEETEWTGHGKGKTQKTVTKHRCAICEGESKNKIHGEISLPDHEFVSRIDAAVSAAGLFLEEFAATSIDGARRLVRITKYASDILSSNEGGWIDIADTTVGEDGKTNLERLKAYISTIEYKSGTNTDAGLKKAEEFLDESDINDINNRFVVLLTDGEPHNKTNDDLSEEDGYKLKNEPFYTKRDKASYDNPAKRIYKMQNDGTKVYSISFAAGATAQNWLEQMSDMCVGAESAPELVDAFEKICYQIKLSVDAWKVTVPMGDYIIFDKTVGNHTGLDLEGDALKWDLAADIVNAKIIGIKDGKKTALTADEYKNWTGEVELTYTLTYRVKLDVQGMLDASETFTKDDLDRFASEYFKTNGDTTLVYDLTQVTDGVTQFLDDNGEVITNGESLLTLHFSVPAVKGFAAVPDLVNKTDNNGKALAGAEFSVFKTENGKATGSAIETRTSVLDGETASVTFTKLLPVGSYTLKETKSPAKYAVNETEYPFTVSYGVASDYQGAEDGLLTVVNAPVLKTTTLTIKKVWRDGNNADNKRPDSVPITITATYDDAHTEVVTSYSALTAADGWTLTTDELPVVELDAEGNKAIGNITYSVTEGAVEGYICESVGTDEDGNTVITNTIANALSGTRDFEITKTWVGGEAKEVTVDLYRISAKPDSTEEKVGTYTVPSEGYLKIANLNKKDADGFYYTYSIKEVTVEGYTPVVSGSAIKNVLTQETTSVSGSKTWNVKALSAEQMANLSATITLSGNAGGTEVYTSNMAIECTDGAIAFSFTGLPKYAYTIGGAKVAKAVLTSAEYANVTAAEEIVYTLSETTNGTDSLTNGDTIEETRSGNDFVNTLKGSESVTVEKKWVDDNYPTRPAVTLVLDCGIDEYKKEVAVATDTDIYTKTVTVEKYDAAGAKLSYTLSEKEAEGGRIDIEDDLWYAAEVSGYTVTNTLCGPTTNIQGTKTWVDGDNEQNLRPDSITVQLYRKLAGESEWTALEGQTAEASADAATPWAFGFDELPTLVNGKAAAYSVKEAGETDGTYTVAGGLTYNVSYSGNNITNTIAQEKRSITVTKTWDDADNANNTRPDAVEFVLKNESGTVATKAAVADTWTCVFENIDKYDPATGKLINYTVEEVVPAGYETATPAVAVPATGEVSVENKLVDDGVTVSVTKVWNNGEADNSGKKVTVDLYSSTDGAIWTYVTSEVITANGTAVFSAEKYDDNYVPYIYKVEESAMFDGSEDISAKYNAPVISGSGNSFTITNTKTVVTKDISVEKAFLGPKTESVSVGLFKDGELVSTAALSDANEWKYTFKGYDVTNASYVAYSYEVRELADASDVTGIADGAVSGDYTVSYTVVDDYTYITNTINQKDVALSIAKNWANMDKVEISENLSYEPKAEPVKVQLGYMVGDTFKPYGEAVVLTGEETTPWTVSYTDLPMYALAAAGLDISDGSKITYAVREFAKLGEDSYGVYLDSGDALVLTDGCEYTVSYGYDDAAATFTVTNTFDLPYKYYYSVDRHYKATIDGQEKVNEWAAYTGIVTVLEGEDREIKVGEDIDANADELIKYGEYTYTLVGIKVQVFNEETGAYEMVDGDTLNLEKYNHEYVIELYYEYEYTAPAPVEPYEPEPIDPTKDPDKDPEDPKDPKKDPDDPEDPIEIIEDPEVPLAGDPEELEELEDPEVPLADVPETGDATGLYLAASALSVSGIAFCFRRKDEELTESEDEE